MRTQLIIAICFILISCGRNADKARENFKNLKKVTLGMSEADVVKIMGTPNEKDISPYTTRNYRFIFDSPPGMSDHIIIFSVKDSLVVGINDGQ